MEIGFEVFLDLGEYCCNIEILVLLKKVLLKMILGKVFEVKEKVIYINFLCFLLLSIELRKVFILVIMIIDEISYKKKK